MVQNINKTHKPRSGKGFKNISSRDTRLFTRIVRKNPLLSSREIFEMAGKGDVKIDMRCRMLRQISSVKKFSSRPDGPDG